MSDLEEGRPLPTKVWLGTAAILLSVYSAYVGLSLALSIHGRAFEYVMFPSEKALNDQEARLAAERTTTEGIGCELWGRRSSYNGKPAIRFRFSGDTEIERILVGCIQRRKPRGYELVKTPWLTMKFNEWLG